MIDVETTNMDFWIQASNPILLKVVDEEDHTISDAMETVFPMITEDAYLVWHHVHIPLNYKYTFSCMIDDVLVIIEALTSSASGELTNYWPVQELAAEWRMKWDSNRLEIDTKWDTVVGNTESLLAARPKLTIDKDAFIAEWKPLLGMVLKALTDAGYRDEQLTDLARLRRIHDAIPTAGILYSTEG
jgi:hypothetical protein